MVRVFDFGNPEIRPAPGGWSGSEHAAAPESWRLPVPDEVADELRRIAVRLAPDGLVMDPLRPRPALSPESRSFIADVYCRLAGEPGFVVLTGFPIRDQPGLTERIYELFGSLLGTPVRENAFEEHFVARVEAVGRDRSRPGPQGYRRPIELPFHVDACTDLIGLLCVRPAERGGISRVISSMRLHNVMLDECPALLSELYQPLPFKVPPLRVPDGCEAPRWCRIPMFSQFKGRFAAQCDRGFVEQTQAFDDAPPLTQLQVAAFDAVDEVLSRPDLWLEMNLRAGDLQLVNNLLVMHARTAYQDESPGPGRLLLRMHLAFADSPALPADFAPLFGATAAGTYRGGKWRTGEPGEWLGTPLDKVTAP